MTPKFKIGEIILNDFRETYDRETHRGVIMSIKWEKGTFYYRVHLLGKDETGTFDTGTFEIRTAGKLTPTGDHIEDLKSLYQKE